MTSSNGNGHGLRAQLEAAIAETGLGLGKLSVLAAQNDPFRVATVGRQRDGEWLAMQVDELNLAGRTIHLRGLHYMLVSAEAVKPDGTPYKNNEADWIWLQADAAKAARWLGLVPFEQIVDARNTPPTIRIFEQPDPGPVLHVGVDIDIPDPDDLEPQIGVTGFVGVQPYKLVLYGEKTSLGEVLIPVAEQRKADLYLPAGEISDTLLHTMAKIGAEDGRPMVVLAFSDCDPAGWQMPISIGRKLQALKALEFPDLEFQVHRVALTPDQVREYGLPSTPLKDTERRADKWELATGTRQTEIDALAALRPDLLTKIARQAISPFFDTGLDRRVSEARFEWLDRAQARLEEQLDPDAIGRIRTEAAAKLSELSREIEAINSALDLDISAFDLPEIEVPNPEITTTDHREPLIDSDWPWVEQTTKLIASKAYSDAR